MSTIDSTTTSQPVESTETRSLTAPAWLLDESPTLRVGNREMPSRYFLAPLAGYTQLAFRLVLREHGGLGLATTDLVQAVHLVHGHRKSVQLIQTCPEDHPLAVQIYGGKTHELVKAARLLEQKGYASVDINMGCPMAKVVGTGGGARLMCSTSNATDLVEQVVKSVAIPVTVKMRLGWDERQINAPELARAFEEVGVAAITIHGRTRHQGFSGTVNVDGIRQVVEAVRGIPVIGNGDVRTVADAIRMRELTGCPAVAIGRGAMLDPWIFARLQRLTRGESLDWEPTVDEQIRFLRRHFNLMTEHRTEEWSCIDFRKFAAWYGARLGIPEDLEDRLRRFTSCVEFEEILGEIRQRHGTRRDPRPTSDIKVPNGPMAYW